MKEEIHDYYELLDLAPGASQIEIEEAYKKAKETYGKNSVATYSLYSNQERDELLRKITKAYEKLTDPEAREYIEDAVRSDDDHHGIHIVHGKEKDEQKLDEPEMAATGEGAALRQTLEVMDDKDPVATEQYRVLFTKLEQLSFRNSKKVFAITSSVKGEGKTVTSMNLAYIMAADFKKKVALVEGDLKNPSISINYLNGLETKGLVSYLKGEATLEDILVKVDGPDLYVIPARTRVRNSSELLNSTKLKRLVEDLRARFDYVIFDTPPILPLADISLISKVVDGLLLVVRAGKTRKSLVKSALASISIDNFLGSVLNGADTPIKKYYY